MGTVFKAEHRLMERLVALKVIASQLTAKPDAVERFRREVKAAARLTHPNIVTAYDAEQAGDTHFLVMEYVEGITLARLVTDTGPLPVPHACDYIRQAAVGLQHAYEQGMVHRDIKPQSLMLAVSGQRSAVSHQPAAPSTLSATATTLTPDSRPLTPVIKILDFGLARFASELDASTAGAETLCGADTVVDDGISRVIHLPGLTDSGAVIGTPDYIAPEQARDPRAADIRADIYSLGCTLYYLLAGHGPFPAGSVVDKVLGHLTAAPRPLAKLRGDVPPDLVRVIERMMTKDHAERYQTPAEVAYALAPFATGAMEAAAEPSKADTVKLCLEPRNLSTVDLQAESLVRRPLAPDTRQRGVRRIAAVVASILVTVGAFFALQQVTIRIKDKHGQTKEITVPQGSTIEIDAAGTGASNRDIFALAADASREIRLVEHAADDRLLGWSSDGKWVVFASDRRGVMGLYALPVEGASPQAPPVLLKPDIGAIMPTGFTRDGSLYYAVDTRLKDVYIASLDVPARKLLAPPVRVNKRYEGNSWAPDWSPDGRYLAYMSGRPGAKAPLVIHRLEDGEEREMHGEFVAEELRWSPDMRYLVSTAYHPTGGPRRVLYRIDAQTGEATTIEPPEGVSYPWNPSRPVFAPDGKTVFYEAGGLYIRARELESRHEKALDLTVGMHGHNALRLSRHGPQVAFFRRADITKPRTWQLMVVTGPDEESRELVGPMERKSPGAAT